jgi:hypothetical protein
MRLQYDQNETQLSENQCGEPKPKKNQEKGGGEMVEKDSFNLWHRHCPKAAFIPIQQ